MFHDRVFLAARRHRTAATCLAGAISLFVIGCEHALPEVADPPAPVVQVTRPIERDVTEYTYFTGRLDAEQAVSVQARVTGYLVSVDFEPGAEVKANQRLFLIDPRPYQAQLEMANSQVALAEAKSALAHADLARAREANKTPGAISRMELDRYTATQSEADAQLAAAKANAESARLNVEFTEVLAPIDGRVGRNLITVGNLVKQDTTLLTTVVSQDPIFAYFDVDEFTVLKISRMIREGKIKGSIEAGDIPVEMGLADEGDRYPHAGTLNFVNNALDPSTGTLQTRAAFPNPKSEHGARMFTPGMFVRIRLPMGDPIRALLVPQAAIATDQGLKYVYTVDENDVVQYRPVRLGSQQPGGMQVVYPVPMIQTEAGLRAVEISDDGTPNVPQGTQTIDSIDANSLIVVSGLQRVRPGRKVRILDDTHSPAPATTPQQHSNMPHQGTPSSDGANAGSDKPRDEETGDTQLQPDSGSVQDGVSNGS